jgi:hypothetical protein
VISWFQSFGFKRVNLSNLYTTVFADVPTGHKLWREEVFGGAVYKLNSIDAELESAYSSFNP